MEQGHEIQIPDTDLEALPDMEAGLGGIDHNEEAYAGALLRGEVGQALCTCHQAKRYGDEIRWSGVGDRAEVRIETLEAITRAVNSRHVFTFGKTPS